MAVEGLFRASIAQRKTFCSYSLAPILFVPAFSVLSSEKRLLKIPFMVLLIIICTTSTRLLSLRETKLIMQLQVRMQQLLSLPFFRSRMRNGLKQLSINFVTIKKDNLVFLALLPSVQFLLQQYYFYSYSTEESKSWCSQKCFLYYCCCFLQFHTTKYAKSRSRLLLFSFARSLALSLSHFPGKSLQKKQIPSLQYAMQYITRAHKFKSSGQIHQSSKRMCDFSHFSAQKCNRFDFPFAYLLSINFRIASTLIIPSITYIALLKLYASCIYKAGFGACVCLHSVRRKSFAAAGCAPTFLPIWLTCLIFFPSSFCLLLLVTKEEKVGPPCVILLLLLPHTGQQWQQ